MIVWVLGFIVDKLQNYHSLARLAVLFYTVVGKAAFYTIEVYRLYFSSDFFRQPEKTAVIALRRNFLFRYAQLKMTNFCQSQQARFERSSNCGNF